MFVKIDDKFIFFNRLRDKFLILAIFFCDISYKKPNLLFSNIIIF